MTIENFKPCYTWPGERIPFRVYFNDEKVRIFIIENLQFNFKWMKQFKNKFKENDTFIVLNTTYYHDWLVNEASEMFEALGMNRNQFKILFNDIREKELFEKYGFFGEIVNLYSWLKNSESFTPTTTTKKYSSIYIARFIESNNHELLSNVPDLALISNNNFEIATINKIPPYKYLNESELIDDDIAKKINESSCGLALTAKDFGEFSICKYLLCGIPVISLKGEGVRQKWLNDKNSVIVEADPEKIKHEIQSIKDRNFDSLEIRNLCLDEIAEDRKRFEKLLKTIFIENDINYIDTLRLINDRLRNIGISEYRTPNFEYIFNDDL